jgi:hypothetical protein
MRTTVFASAPNCAVLLTGMPGSCFPKTRFCNGCRAKQTHRSRARTLVGYTGQVANCIALSGRPARPCNAKPGAIGIERDERWPDLWRVRFGDGTRSGPLNRARALEGWHALKLKKSEGQP